MSDPFNIELPPVLQWAAVIGTAIAGFVTWLFSRRTPVPATGDDADELRIQLRIGALQRDFEQVIAAQREATFEQIRRERRDWEHEIGELENRVRQLEIGYSRRR